MNLKKITLTLFSLVFVVVGIFWWLRSAGTLRVREAGLLSTTAYYFPDAASFRVEKTSGQWALVSIGFDPGGGTLAIMKYDGSWEYVADGNEIWDCRAMAEQGVPPEIYDTCWDYAASE